MSTNQIIPVIMCGGAGTRLWPVSRESMPKQFVQLVGDHSTFQQALLRVSGHELFAKPVVIANLDTRFVVAEQARRLNIDINIYLEPTRRDSAAAVAVAAELAKSIDPKAVVLVISADHIIDPPDAFRAACQEAMLVAASGRIVTFGITPVSPATNYGYIRPGSALNGGSALVLEAFVEKPDAATAARYVNEGYLWNSGNFIFRADIMCREITRFAPAISEAVQEAILAGTKDLDFMRLAEIPFSKAPRTSIDYAVMEKTDCAAVLPVDYRWSDVGSWDAVWDLAERDTNDNAVVGTAELFSTSGCFVRSDDSIMTAVVGCKDLIIVATGDAVLVSSRAEAEQVKTVVEELKRKNRKVAVEHRRMYRPWGYYQGVDSADRYQVKRIVVMKGAKLSLQKHHHRSEHWVVVRGTAEVTVGDEVRIVHENESTYIPIGSVHRLANPGKIPLELIEVQVGSYLGEDDILRLEDVYHR